MTGDFHSLGEIAMRERDLLPITFRGSAIFETFFVTFMLKPL